MKFFIFLLSLLSVTWIHQSRAQTQSSAPRSEEIPMDDIEDDDTETAEVEETEVIEKPLEKIKGKQKIKGQMKASLGKEVDGTRALDRGEFETQTLGVSKYKRNGALLEVDPD